MTTLRVTRFNPASNLGTPRKVNDDRPRCPECGARMDLRAAEETWPERWVCNRTFGCARIILFEIKAEGDEHFSRRLRPIVPDFPAAEDWRGPFNDRAAAARGAVSC